MSEAPIKLDIKFDVIAITHAFEQIGRLLTEIVKPIVAAFEEFGRQITQFWENLKPFAREMMIVKYGADNETQDGVWQSNMCATWLHDDCRAHVYCDCKCHS